ncbi:MAG TPA: RCC1 domain-containing protein [Polyangiaceae bacterium]|nr:RCC1 domain-containing protein [Polyangiaceae bacterium]
MLAGGGGGGNAGPRGDIAASAVHAGGSFSCALTVSPGAFCWGDNFRGQLDDGTLSEAPHPPSPIVASKLAPP